MNTFESHNSKRKLNAGMSLHSLEIRTRIQGTAMQTTFGPTDNWTHFKHSIVSTDLQAHGH